ncbi:hypothetical protein Y1Q_0022392 [Alligator mississippiensis]|uniref:Phospholipid/glycerol acyltransferase domain-containing protein n=1 Tax=Alligator mississippiensis TaxID=8496 RepID=A0A151P137_ALLMI|nr:hypothetical protein Y1Q_0022392 [Alligator mississippiensis]
MGRTHQVQLDAIMDGEACAAPPSSPAHMVGQVHEGFLGIIQRSCIQTSQHLWFEHAEMRDCRLVREKMSEHIRDKKKLPVLIFPEGTCINNTSVKMFKMGSFEIGGTIYPVAIKVTSNGFKLLMDYLQKSFK